MRLLIVHVFVNNKIKFGKCSGINDDSCSTDKISNWVIKLAVDKRASINYCIQRTEPCSLMALTPIYNTAHMYTFIDLVFASN